MSDLLRRIRLIQPVRANPASKAATVTRLGRAALRQRLAPFALGPMSPPYS
jgi:hypothetical protein